MTTPAEFATGDHVQVYVFQRWRPARVLRAARTRVLVEYLIPRGKRTKRETWLPIGRLRRS